MISRFRKLAHKTVGVAREFRLVVKLALPEVQKVVANRQTVATPVTVAMTSHPGRIRHAWLAIETLLRQDVRPTRLLLVLSDEDFPNRKIPRSLTRQARRGLEIHWVQEDGKSYDKLLPIRALDPAVRIITVDDDKYFPANLVRLLTDSADKNPESVIGARGWRIVASASGVLAYGKRWERITAEEKGRNLFMPGGNGCLYPPGSLDSRVDDFGMAEAICPTADDIWFWAAWTAAGTESVCLGLPPHRSISRQSKSAALSQINVRENNRQWQAAIQHFKLDSVLDSVVPGAESSGKGTRL